MAVIHLLPVCYKVTKRGEFRQKIWKAKLGSVILPPEIHVGSVSRARYDIANFNPIHHEEICICACSVPDGMSADGLL